MDQRTCSACGAAHDPQDNFCRRCGRALNVALPAVRPARARAVVRRQFLPSPLVGSMALLAIGTGVEWLARRMAGSAARAAGKALIGMADGRKPQRTTPQDASIDEFLYVRKVQLRR